MRGWCVKPGPKRITTATRPGVWSSMNPPTGATPSSTGPQRIATATRPGVRCSMFCDCKTSGVFEWYVLFLQNQPGPVWVLVRETWPAADRNCNPARCVESLTCIRSIEGTASSPGPMDHNCNPARCVSLDESTHGSNAIEYRPAGDHNCNPARGVLFDDPSHGSNAIEYRPAADHNCNPARAVLLDRFTHGSNAIEYRPAADHNCNPARRVLLDVLRLQIQSN